MSDSIPGEVEIDLSNPDEENNQTSVEIEDAESARESDRDAEQATAQEDGEDEEEKEQKLARRRQRRQKSQLKKAKSENALLADQVRQLMATVQGLSHGQTQVNRQVQDQELGRAIQGADQRVQAAQFAYRQARAAGDVEAELRATEALQEAKFYRYQLGSHAEQLRRQAQQPAPQPQRQVTRDAAEWAQDNSDWYGVDQRDTQIAAAYDTALAEEYTAQGAGHLIGCPEYLEDLDRRLEMALPHRFQREEPKQKPRQTVAGTRGGSREGGGKVRVPRALIDAARQAGLNTDDPSVLRDLAADYTRRQNRK